jgi:hypothetical protein
MNIIQQQTHPLRSGLLETQFRELQFSNPPMKTTKHPSIILSLTIPLLPPYVLFSSFITENTSYSIRSSSGICFK